MLQSETTVQNLKSGQEVAKTIPSDSSSKSISRTHKEYWRGRLERHCYTHEGKLVEVNEWSVRVQYRGVRKSFPLRTNNTEAAAVKARDIYLKVVAEGWDAALAQFNPAMLVKKDDPTIGEFLNDVSVKSGLKPKTFHNYASCLRLIVAGVFKIEGGKEKFDHKTGGRSKWLEKVDAVKLNAITPEKVQAWKVAYLRRHGTNPVRLQSVRRSVNTYMRCARNLFSRRLVKFIGVRLPAPLPFEGIEMEKPGSTKYASIINVRTLVNDAKTELKPNHPDSYKAFLLGLFCGLRRGEMDSLEWAAVDWENGRIKIGNAEFLSVKTDGSEALVEVDAEVLEELKAFCPANARGFILDSHLQPRTGLRYLYYRADHHFEYLIGWLRSKGVRANKPIHELRKELGALIVSKHGIYAAAHVLRHSDISTTARHYADQKTRITSGIGGLLK